MGAGSLADGRGRTGSTGVASRLPATRISGRSMSSATAASSLASPNSYNATPIAMITARNTNTTSCNECHKQHSVGVIMNNGALNSIDDEFRNCERGEDGDSCRGDSGSTGSLLLKGQYMSIMKCRSDEENSPTQLPSAGDSLAAAPLGTRSSTDGLES